MHAGEGACQGNVIRTTRRRKGVGGRWSRELEPEGSSSSFAGTQGGTGGHGKAISMGWAPGTAMAPYKLRRGKCVDVVSVLDYAGMSWDGPWRKEKGSSMYVRASNGVGEDGRDRLQSEAFGIRTVQPVHGKGYHSQLEVGGQRENERTRRRSDAKTNTGTWRVVVRCQMHVCVCGWVCGVRVRMVG